MKTIALFNNKGGVGKTSLVYHLTWTYADWGLKIVAADFDPQANLTSMFLEEERLVELWPEEEQGQPRSISATVKPILKGTGDIAPPYVETVTEEIGLIVGDLGLSLFEDKLSDAWPRCLDRDEAAFRIISAFHRILVLAAQQQKAEIVLIDVGPNLGAINRAALIAADYVVIPLAPDLFSLQGLKNLGPRLRDWREGWQERLSKNPNKELVLPTGQMQPAGYVILQHNVRSDRPVKAYSRWMEKMPATYREEVRYEKSVKQLPTVENDEYCLATLKHYRSLMSLAREAHKPMFHLKPADGAIGTHVLAAKDCGKDFKGLARKIAEACEFEKVLPNDN